MLQGLHVHRSRLVQCAVTQQRGELPPNEKVTPNQAALQGHNVHVHTHEIHAVGSPSSVLKCSEEWDSTIHAGGCE